MRIVEFDDIGELLEGRLYVLGMFVMCEELDMILGKAESEVRVQLRPKPERLLPLVSMS